MSKRVVIIGAGVAGLTAGIYARRSGLEVRILEQHTIPGGMCTSWRRKGYLFEGAMHWLTGSSPKSTLYELWREVGALGDGVKVQYDEPFRKIEWEGQIVSLYRDLDRLREHFREISPDDAPRIKRLCSDVRALSKIKMPIMDVKGVKSENPRKMSLGVLFKMLPVLPRMGKLGKISVAEYAAGFKHPALRRLLGSVVPEEYSASSLIFTLATLACGDGGYPEGGSLAMALRMADAFKALGGELCLGAKVDKIVQRDGHVTGVAVGGEVISADAVIITQETIAAAEQLFDAPPTDAWLADLKRDTKSSACCFVGVGVRASIPETPMFELAEPIKCGGVLYSELSLNNYTGYAGYAPEGGVALTSAFIADTYDFWKKARDEGRYEAEKLAVAEQVSRAICAKYPQASGNIEVVDVATPLTYERYTGAYHGSWMSVMGKGENNRQYPGYLDSVKGVYFAGHRMMTPGGMPVALMSGRSAAQMACRQLDVVFK